MSVTRSDVINTAKLANLALDENAIPELQESMNKIVTMFDDLNSVNTESVKHLDILQQTQLESLPTSNKAHDEDNIENISEFAIEFDKNTGEFLVPKVIDEE